MHRARVACGEGQASRTVWRPGFDRSVRSRTSSSTFQCGVPWMPRWLFPLMTSQSSLSHVVMVVRGTLYLS